jgi:GTPase
MTAANICAHGLLGIPCRGARGRDMTKQLPHVTIVGRQNVGKSTLFNALIRQKKAIVDDTPGLTRDVISCHVEHRGAAFILSDTPGLDINDPSSLSQAIRENATKFLARSSAIILLLENPSPCPFDYELADMVRKLSVPSIIAVNKMDSTSDYANLSSFYELGFNDILPISAKGRGNISLLLDKIVDALPFRKTAAAPSDLKIAIVGRPNSGKSSLLNAFIGFDRSVVSDVPGTTRDAVDEDFGFQGKRITLIDTAGIRRKSRINDSIDYYSITRTVEALKRCDVAIHLMDAQAGITETDKKIADVILDAHKPLIIAINKWDAIEKNHKTFDEFKDRMVFRFYRAGDFPIISISAKEKLRIHRLITIALELQEKTARRIETPRLNRVVEQIQRSGRVPKLGTELKIFYITQTETKPPRFKAFVNKPDLFRREMVRAIEKVIQDAFDLQGIPVSLLIEGRKKKE